MADYEQTSRHISMVDEAGGIERKEFTTDEGISGNVNIDLPKAFKNNPQLLTTFAESMAEELDGADVLISNGSALMIAKEIVRLTDKEYVVIGSKTFGGVKNFRLHDNCYEPLNREPSIGVVGDVSCSLGTVEKMLAQTGLGPLVVKIAVGWRRGQPAPVGMRHNAIEAHNELFRFKDLYEYNLDIPVSGVIERHVPLWVPTGPQVFSYLPEVSTIYDPAIGSVQPYPNTYQEK